MIDAARDLNLHIHRFLKDPIDHREVFLLLDLMLLTHRMLREEELLLKIKGLMQAEELEFKKQSQLAEEVTNQV